MMGARGGEWQGRKPGVVTIVSIFALFLCMLEIVHNKKKFFNVYNTVN